MQDVQERGFCVRSRRWLIPAVMVVCVVGTLVVAQASKGSKAKEEEPPFRLGKAQSETMQVSVREVGVVGTGAVCRWDHQGHVKKVSAVFRPV